MEGSEQSQSHQTLTPLSSTESFSSAVAQRQPRFSFGTPSDDSTCTRTTEPSPSSMTLNSNNEINSDKKPPAKQHNNEKEAELQFINSMMKQVAIEKAPRKVTYEHEAVYYQDTNHNQMVAIRIRLPSASMDRDYDIKLKMVGKNQYLSITHKLCKNFLSSSASKATIGQIVGTVGREWENYMHNQEELHKNLKKAHGNSEGGELAGEKAGGEGILSEFLLKLKFECDDIFDESLKEYPKTGHLFQRVMVPGVTRHKKDIEIMTIFSIVLVSKVKVERKQKKTPVKKRDVVDLVTDCFDSDDEQDDEDYNMRTPRQSMDDGWNSLGNC